MAIIQLNQSNPFQKLYMNALRVFPLSEQFDEVIDCICIKKNVASFLEEKIYFAMDHDIDLCIYLLEKVRKNKYCLNNKSNTYYVNLRISNFQKIEGDFGLQIPFHPIPNDGKRKAIDDMLRQLRENNDAAEWLFLIMIDNTSLEILDAMVRYLAAYPQKEVIFLLKKFAMHEDSDIASLAIWALGYFKYPETLDILKELIDYWTIVNLDQLKSNINEALVGSSQKLVLGVPKLNWIWPHPS